MNLTITRISALFYLETILILIGACHPFFTYFSIICAVMVAIRICMLRGTGSIDVAKGIITLLLLQNFCIGLGAHVFYNQDDTLKLLTQLPFIIIFVIWFYLWGIKRSQIVSKKIKVCFVVLLACIAFAFFLDRGTFQTIAVTVRNLTVFYMAYEIGANSIKNEWEVNDFIKHILKWAVFLSVVGLLISIGGYDIYKTLGIHEVYIAKAAAFSEGRLDGRFYTSFFSDATYVRMGSIVYEPVNLAYFMALSVICAKVINPWRGIKGKVCIAIVVIGLIFTFGKGGYMITGLAFLFYIIDNYLVGIRAFLGTKIFSILLLLVITVVTVLFAHYYISNYGLAALNHVWGVINTLASVIKKPIGYGIGTGGNAAQVLNESKITTDDWLASGGETAYMSFMYQIGVQGVIVLTSIFFLIAHDMKLRKTKLEKTFYYMPFILLGVSLLQDNTFTPQCIVPFMLLQGALCHYRLNEKYTNLKG